MDDDFSFEYLVVLIHFLAFCYLIVAPKSKVKTGVPRRRTLVGAVLGTLNVSMAVGLSWFFLWMLSFERVPHGLWGFGMALAALALMTFLDSRTRK